MWGSWLEMHPDTAVRLGVEANQVVEISTAAGKVAAPVFVYPGVAPNTIAMPFGQGHTAYGRYAAQRGANAFQLLEARPSETAPSPAVTATTGLGTERVVTTDFGLSQKGRPIIEIIPASRLRDQRPGHIDWPLPKGYTKAGDLYSPHEHKDHRWALAIDLSRCVGCAACVAACYAENNVAVVGKKWVAQGREMSWIRIDRYFDWSGPYPPARFLVMLCQHCDGVTARAPQTQTSLRADQVEWKVGDKEVYANGNVKYVRGGVLLAGPRLRADLSLKKARLEGGVQMQATEPLKTR